MFNNKDTVVNPTDKDKYYTYSLCKPCGTPFYIGKGKLGRINSHFTSYSLKKATYKNNTIRKYGISVIRSILTYHESEDEAYRMEDWLLQHYGFLDEGGLLTNVLKCRGDIKNIPSRLRVHTDESKSIIYPDKKVYRALHMFYHKLSDVQEISVKLGIHITTLKEFLKGESRKYLYESYMNKHGSQSVRRSILNFDGTYYNELQVKEVYQLYFEESYTVRDISLKTGIPSNYIPYLTRGVKHKSLYNKYITSGEITDKRQTYIPVESETIKYSDTLICNIYKVAASLKLGAKSIASIYGMSSLYAMNVLQGRKRVGLYNQYHGTGYKRDSKGHTTCSFGTHVDKLIAGVIYKTQDFSLREVSVATGVPKTTLKRAADYGGFREITLIPNIPKVTHLSEDSVAVVIEGEIKEYSHTEFKLSVLNEEAKELYIKYLQNTMES